MWESLFSLQWVNVSVKWAMPCENVYSGIYAQSDQGLHGPLTEWLDTIECINAEQMPGSDFSHARDEYESENFAYVLFAWLLWFGRHKKYVSTELDSTVFILTSIS